MGASVMDDSRQFALLLIYVMAPLSTLAVMLRSYSRWFIVRSFGRDDKLAVASCVGNFVVSITYVVIIDTGGGSALAVLSLEDFGKILKLMWGLFPVTQFTLCCIQLSYLAFYTRFLVDRSYQVLIYLACFILVQHVLFTLLILFRCHPVSNVWDPIKIRSGCLDWPKMTIAHSVVNIFCDLSVYTLPLPSVFKLHVSIRRKLSLLCLFALGFIVMSASVWRLYTLILFNMGGDAGNSFASLNAATIEYNLAIIIASMPGIKPLFMKFLDIKSNPGTFRMSLNTIVYGAQSAPARLESTSPYSTSDIAIREATSDPGTSAPASNERLRLPC